MNAVQSGIITLTAAERVSLVWVKSEYSTAYGECIEVASAPGKIAIRDSKDPDGLILLCTPANFRTFVDNTRNGKIGGLLAR
jgi:hypothetical protein